jgi:uncharacterized protein (AIM24 family)/Flp pilus assembly protein TadD
VETTPPSDQGPFFVHLSRARRGVREGKFEEAWGELERARELRPQDEDVLNLLSLLEFKRGHYNEAAAAARRLLADNPQSEVLRANLGLILFKAGFLAEAELELRKAIELAPGHLRSHLYLGLLYQSRGKLGLALEHLRVAGARRRVSLIEEALRRPNRDGPRSVLAEMAALRLREAEMPSRTTAPAVAAAGKPATPAAAPVIAAATAPPQVPETPAAAAPPAASASGPAPVSASAVPAPTDPPFVVDEEPEAPLPPAPTAPEARPLFKIRPEGGVEIASRGVVFVRKGCVTWYSGKMKFGVEQVFKGTSLERILRASGVGSLLVHDPGRRAFRKDLNGQTLYVEGTRLLALDSGLTFRMDGIQDFRKGRRVDVLRVQGQGAVVFSVGGPVIAHEVTSALPLSISSRDLVAWSGELVASVLDDRFLEEVMQPDIASPPKIRFEGDGTVFTEPPRPRRRASDADRAVDQRRN